MKKALKWVLIAILVVIVCVIVVVGKKMLLLSRLDKSVCTLENTKDNIYIKIVNTGNPLTDSTCEIFVKGDVEKFSMKRNDVDRQILQITYPTERKVFGQEQGKKTLYKEEHEPSKRSTDLALGNVHSLLVNFAHSETIMQRILIALNTKIVKTRIDDKDCYELSGMKSPIFIYSINATAMSAYVDASTGLPVKLVEIVNENGIEKEWVTTYEVKFDCVTDEDMVEPNEAEYEVMQ